MDKRKIWLTIPIFSALVFTMAIGVMAYSSSAAANNSPTMLTQGDSGEETPPWDGYFGGKRGYVRGGRFGFGTSFDYDEFIAGELGVTVAELQEARQAAHEAALEQAVSEGVITVEQAELIKAGRALKQYLDPQEILSQALGIDAAELEAARAEGKSLPYLFGELGLDPADIKASIKSAYEDAIQRAVKDGVITASQAEKLREKGFAGRVFGKRGHGLGLPFQKPAPGSDWD